MLGRKKQYTEPAGRKEWSEGGQAVSSCQELRLQLVDAAGHRQAADPPGGGEGRRQRGKDQQRHDAADGGKGQLPDHAPVVGDHLVIEEGVERQPQPAAYGEAQHRVGGGLGKDHGFELGGGHAHRPHGAVLPGAGGHAQRDAVHRVDHGDQRDDGQEPIDKEAEHPVGVAGVPVEVQPVVEIPVPRQGLEFRHRFPGGIGGQLDIHHRVAALPGEFRKKRLGADDGGMVVGGEGTVLQHPQHRQGGIADLDGVPHLQGVVLVEHREHPFPGPDGVQVARGEGAFGPAELLFLVGDEVDGLGLALVLCLQAGIHPAEGTFHVGLRRHFFGEILGNFAGVGGAAVKDIRGPGLQGIEGQLHPLHHHREGENQQDAQRKGAGHEQQVFGRFHRMVDAQGNFHTAACAAHGPRGAAAPGVVAADRRHRADTCGPPGRCPGGEQHGEHPHHHAADDAHRADGEEGDLHKLRPGAEPQQGAKAPGGQDSQPHPQGHGGFAPVEGLPPDQPHDLGLAGADTAQHAVKLGALGGLAVQAARDHKDPRRQHQHKEDGGHQIHPQHIGINAETGKPQQGGILRESLVGKAVLLPPPVQHLAGVGVLIQPHKPHRGQGFPLGVGQTCKSVPAQDRPHHAGVGADGHIGAEAGNGIDELPRRGVEGDFVPHFYREHGFGPPGEKDLVLGLREVPLGQVVVNFGQDGFVAAHHHAGLAAHGVVLRQGVVQPVVP